MPKEKLKTIYVCTQCGETSPRWLGRCPSCGAWNTIVEQPERPKGAGKGASVRVGITRRRACPVTDLTADEEIRFPTGMGELDRVLGGGAVKGSLVLVGGAPGIGKSTLMLQICSKLCEFSKVLYISGEESEHQLKLRAKRLHVESQQLLVLSETNLGDVLEAVNTEQPDVLIVDSIQTLYNDALDAAARLLTRLYALAEGKPCLLRFGKMESGSARNAVSDHTHLEGSLRCLDDGLFAALWEQAQAIGRAVGEETGCTVTMTCSSGYPPVTNDAALLAEVRERFPIAEAETTCITEDFSEYQRHVPGVFFFLGTGGIELHAPTFTFPEEILDKGEALLCGLV